MIRSANVRVLGGRAPRRRRDARRHWGRPTAARRVRLRPTVGWRAAPDDRQVGVRRGTPGSAAERPAPAMMTLARASGVAEIAGRSRGRGGPTERISQRRRASSRTFAAPASVQSDASPDNPDQRASGAAFNRRGSAGPGSRLQRLAVMSSCAPRRAATMSRRSCRPSNGRGRPQHMPPARRRRIAPTGALRTSSAAVTSAPPPAGGVLAWVSSAPRRRRLLDR